MGFFRESMIHAIKKNREMGASTILKMIGLDGGKGSGNFGHKGRPGQRGGSGKGGSEGSESSGSSSGGSTPAFMNTRMFKGIAVKARKNPNDSQKFLDSLSEDESQAILEQHRLSGTSENSRQYADRLHRMMASTPAPKHEPKVVDGKDITKDYHWDRKVRTNEFGQQIDTQIEDVLDQQGFMGVPKVVGEEEFERITKEHPEMPILFRSYSAPDEATLGDYDKQLESGEWYVDCGVGGAQYGQGMYAAGMYIVPPKQWDDGGAFNSVYGEDYIIGADGKTYEKETPEDVEDYWMSDGSVYVLSKRDGDSVTSTMVEVIKDEDDEDGLGTLFRDLETGDLYDLNWLYEKYPEGRDTQMVECQERNPEEPFKVDYSDTFEEMRHYRKINEEKLSGGMFRPGKMVPQGMTMAPFKDGNGEERYLYFDREKQKTLAEEYPESGTYIMYNWKAAKVEDDGSLNFGDYSISKDMINMDLKWCPLEGEVKKPDINPVSSTRKMTFDPSAKIIDYYDIERMGTGHLTDKEAKKINDETFDDLIRSKGITDKDTIEVIRARANNKAPDSKIWRRWKTEHDMKPLEERQRIEKMIYDFDGEYARESLKRCGEAEAKRKEEVKKFEDFGAYAAALGYDAINAGGHGLSGSYTVVLNRSKLILCEGRVDVGE